jgi:hypothetical protein
MNNCRLPRPLRPEAEGKMPEEAVPHARKHRGELDQCLLEVEPQPTTGRVPVPA